MYRTVIKENPKIPRGGVCSRRSSRGVLVTHDSTGTEHIIGTSYFKFTTFYDNLIPRAKWARSHSVRSNIQK